MTLKIEVEVPYDTVKAGDAGAYLGIAMSAIGFYRDLPERARPFPGVGPVVGASLGAAAPSISEQIKSSIENGTFGVRSAVDATEREMLAEDEAAKHATEAPKRERGKPSPGRQRRTREEIAEDEAAERAPAGVDADLKEIVADTNANVPTDDAATAEQDKADEIAERDLLPGPTTLTLDDLRAAVGAYQRTYGMKAVTADVPQMLGKKMIEVTEDELASAIETVKQATDDNPFGRAVVGAEAPQTAAKPEEKQAPAATKDDVRAALMDYALRYDGQNTDPAKAVFTLEDGPKVFKLIFGDEVDAVKKIPPTPENYAKAVAGIREMIAKDPFKRSGKAGV